MLVWPTPKPAVKTAISVLGAAFGAYASVSASMPKQRPVRFVRVSRVGGRQTNVVSDEARILVELFGPDVATVEAMSATARAALRNASATVVDDGVFVRAWENEDGPVDFPHPDIIDMVRWQFHGDLCVSTTTAVVPGS